MSKILREKNEAPCDDAASDFECGMSRSITKGLIPTIKLVNLFTGGRAEFAPKLCIAYWPQTYWKLLRLGILKKYVHIGGKPWGTGGVALDTTSEGPDRLFVQIVTVFVQIVTKNT